MDYKYYIKFRDNKHIERLKRRSPWAIGEYAINEIPSSSQAAFTPFSSGAL